MAQGPPDAPPDNISFSRFTGIKNTVSAERLAPDELQRARDIDIDDAGQIHRRRGQSLVAAGNFHSLFTANDGTVYGVKGPSLGIINPDYSFVDLQDGIGPSHLAYVQVGPVVYFSSLSNSGKITSGGIKSVPAISMVEDGSNGYHFGGVPPAASIPTSTPMTFSVLLKAGARPAAILYSSDGTNTPNCEFDLVHGVAGTPAYCTASITAQGGGWWLATISWTMTNPGSVQFVLFISQAFGAGFAGASYQGVVGKGVLAAMPIWTMAGVTQPPLDLTTILSGATASATASQIGSSVSPWGEAAADFWLSPVVNPTPTLFPIKGRLFGSPPMATILEYFNGRIYLGSGRTIWATELYLYNIVDKTRNFWQFEADLTMIAAVTDGLYVGTEGGLYFISGPQFDQMRRINVLGDGVLPGTLVKAPKELVDPQGRQDIAQVLPSDTAAVFMTAAGLVAAMSGGQVFNLTQTRVQFPVAQTGSALFRKQDGINSYLGVIDSGGTPANTARIGDYVSAQLIRGNGES
jgi:hypothetical protein